MIDAVDGGLGTIDAAPAPDASIAVLAAIPYQAITDHELERFNTFLPPVPIAVAGVFTGMFLATVAGTIRALLAIGNDGIGFGDAFLVAINAMSLGAAVTSAIFAIRGRSDVKKMLTAIRRRAQITIAPEIGPPSST